MKLPHLLLLGAFLLSACNPPTVTPTAAVPTQPQATSTATVEPSPTPVPERSLVVCLTEEPQTLYLYGGASRSMWNVLEALYDGPFDSVSYAAKAVIVEKTPSIADGDAALNPVSVQAGDPVVDVNGQLTALAIGTRVFPSGCTSADCAQTWDGITPLKMDQLSASYQLKAGLKWSDGSPLTAADSVYSFQVASDPATPVSKALLDRTASYTAVDDLKLTWMGVPGFTEQRFAAYFWSPLPSKALAGKSAQDLLSDEGAARSPLGWGPYVMEEWIAGDHITLKKNPLYFRASEGLPRFDHLVYRFLGNPADSALLSLVSGACDIVDRNPGFQSDLEELINTENNGKLKLLLQQGPEWEMLAFGIRPAGYDDGYQPGTDRPDFFGDARMRQAVAQCIDRGALVKEFFFNRTAVPGGTLAPSHPFFHADLQPAAYDPAAGSKLLDEIGWRDTDGDPSTPRVSVGVAGVVDGTPLKLSLLTSQAALRQVVAQRLNKMLLDCGIQATPQFQDAGTLFAPGPGGPLFGRSFDLAEFSWEAGTRPGCALFTSDQVPAEKNQWTGANLTGFSDAAFDAACTSALGARLDQPEAAAAYKSAEEAFAANLPAVPLFFQLHIAITRPDLCGLSLDATARSLLWNLEALDYGKDCPAQ